MERLITYPKTNKDLRGKTVLFSRPGERRFVTTHGVESINVPFQICVLDHGKGIINILTEEGNSLRVPVKGTEYLEFTTPSPVLTHR